MKTENKKPKKGKKSRFRITRTLPNGKRKDFYGATKKEAIEHYEEYMMEHGASNITYSDMQFGALLEIWLYQIKRFDSIKPATFQRYDTIYRNHIASCRLSKIPVYKLKSLDLQYFINDQINEGCSPASIHNTFKVVKMFIHFLHNEDAITRDISKNVKLPRSLDIEQRIRVFSPEEKQVIAEHLSECTHPFVVQLGFASGMRLGEILALKYEDFRDGGVSVNKTLSCSYVISDADTRDRKKMVLPPKTKNSIRFIPLPDAIFRSLAVHKYRHQLILEANKATGKGYCFTMPNGELHDSTSVNGSIRKFFKRCGIENHSFHDLRHTYISSLVEAGIDLATIKDLAGHSDISMTLKYTHIKEEMKRKAVAESADLLCL